MAYKTSITAVVCGLLSLFGGAATAAPYLITPVPIPAQGGSYALGINNIGQIAGSYASGAQTGYIDTNGSIAPFAVAGANTFAYDINDTGTVVGFSGAGDGFSFNAGVFTPVVVPGSGATYVYGINNAGQLAGAYNDFAGSHGFLDTQGVFTTLDVPGKVGQTIVTDINNAGVISGFTLDNSQSGAAFLYANGVYTTVKAPAPNKATFITHINDLGQAVGYYTDVFGKNVFPFIYDQGVFVDPKLFPAGEIYYLNGINNVGQLVGADNGPNATGAFLATPVPEPATWAVLGFGLVGLLAARFRTR